MFISVRNLPLTKQHFPTSCWISAAHFVLQYLNVPVTLTQLENQYYRRDVNAVDAMNGAGHPKNIINHYAFDTGYVAVAITLTDDNKDEVVAAIVRNISANIPVVASIRSPQVARFGHALLLTAVEDTTGSIAFKDPASGTGPGRYSVDVRSQSYEAFRDGFSYRYAQRMGINVFAYCNQVTVMKTFDNISLFD